MSLDNEQIVRKAYQIAEDKDLKGSARKAGCTGRSIPLPARPCGSLPTRTATSTLRS